MDTIELALLDAWKSVYPKLLNDPDELARRLSRRNRALLQQPPRAWCVAIRASDTRINPATAILCPEYAMDLHDPEHRGKVIPHEVIVKSKLLRKLCAPVWLDAPGETWRDVARKLGVAHFSGLKSARIKYALRAHYIRVKGKLTPLLHTNKELDPTARDVFAAPDPLWSWTSALYARVPDDFEQTLQRVPIYRPTRSGMGSDAHPEVASPGCRNVWQLPPAPPDYVWYKWKDGVYVGDAIEQRRRPILERRRQREREHRRNHPRPSRSGGSLQFMGWRWLCPVCGREVQVIYLPLPPVNLLADSGTLPDELVSNHNSQIKNRKSSSFACRDCHQIRRMTRLDVNHWNYVVAHLSGGLLYGREVRKPDEFRTEPVRKKKYSPQTMRPAPRRQEILRKLLNGWTTAQIAADMGISRTTVNLQLWTLCKQESVPNRKALIEKMGGMKGEKKMEPQINTDKHRSEAA